MRSSTPRRQRGSSLLEALIAFCVLALGMVALARLQGQHRLDADVARQRSEAVRLAQEDMESLRAFATAGAAAGVRSFDAIASASRSIDNGTSYVVDRQIADGDVPTARSASITVRWTDRSGTPQQVALHSIIAGTEPALTGAYALVPR